jgi:Putative peptidoglycan binding domain
LEPQLPNPNTFKLSETYNVMNWKKFVLLSCMVQCVFAVPSATAQMRGHRAPMARMPMRRAPMLASTTRMPMHRASTLASTERLPTRHHPMLTSTARMSTHRASMLNSASGFHHFNDGGFDRDDRFRFRNIDEIIFFDNFAFPFFPFFSFYYPYPYYPYPYDAYYPSYGYGGNPGSYGVNDSLVVQVQRRLASDGYYSGPIDGVIGRGTRRAIRAYERDHGLPVDGAIHGRLLVTMGLA